MSVESRSFWVTPKGIAAIGLIVIVAYFLFMEHRQHVIDVLPYLLLGACLLMHGFMHGGHGHSARPDAAESEMRRKEPRRGVGLRMQQTVVSARSLAGIDRVGAEALPVRKAEIVKNLQAEGCTGAMAGNGINDAPVRCNGIEIRQR